MLLYTIYLVAIVAEAMSGAIMGMRRGMDLFGICMIGTVTALGGGTVRDVLLGHYPLGWIAHPEYLLFTIGAAIVTAFVARYLHHLRAVFLLVDGLGLVAFCVIGCDIAMSAKMHPAIVVLAGMITGVFGGLLRDILCNQIPLVLQREVYATVALFTGSLYVGLLYFQVDSSVAQLASIGAGFLFRFLALHFEWRLPNFNGDRIRGFE
ncbi:MULTISPECIES: trimeric intracellular cation channel family protein [Janthinobacterium]|uniref:Trimeric intracellular cation channel family protein n=1 Tax=Janthinobacterium violaceinigrum TaxID=2654252 RepID=A0A6I1I6G0_9BURK|nr:MULTISPECIES: trimeric intracellular cation channel family protein [Janthinobacterium]KAB8062392.1 trimeric intracellular cation channel family protein [Janthinobacterium sp. FT14W]KAB8065289.1 trimeric intracellular cation channel family protein [Janthinobacterium violaceinigrum]MCX7292116.1 trimeric intracellular cation channel family protein [Janthinobacterium sp.]MED5593669.1 trimeric intracellular cation channel family protein [Janthinobacterium sp. P210006]